MLICKNQYSHESYENVEILENEDDLILSVHENLDQLDEKPSKSRNLPVFSGCPTVVAA